jgi:hypothetical protein
MSSISEHYVMLQNIALIRGQVKRELTELAEKLTFYEGFSMFYIGAKITTPTAK